MRQERGKGGTRAPKFGEKYFSGNYNVKFGHFVDFFSYIIFEQKCLAPRVD